MRGTVSAVLFLMGVIHLVSPTGALSAARSASSYGIAVNGPNWLILLGHRAVLFGLLGAFLIVAAFKQRLPAGALFAGLVSFLSFLWLALSTGGYNAEVGKLVTAAVAALALLLSGLGAHACLRWRG